MQIAELANDPKIDQVSSPKSGLVREFLRLWLLAKYRVARGARPWLGIATALATVLVAAFLHFHILKPFLWKSGDVFAALPLTSELARLPMSFFLPTAYLPLWAACLQLVVVLGLSEMILGRWLTVVVAMAGHFGSTLIARLLLETVHSHIFGIMPALIHVLDTGPSGATTAVGACLLVATRLNRCAVLLSIGLIVAAIVTRGVDGVEHTTALVIGMAAGVADYFVISRLIKTRDDLAKARWSERMIRLRRVPKTMRRVVVGLVMRTEAR